MCSFRRRRWSTSLNLKATLIQTIPTGYAYFKSLYRIKQAPRLWNKKLNKFLIESNFKQSNADPCVNTRINNALKKQMTVYVNNLTLIGTPHDISEMKKSLGSRFPIMDLGRQRPS